MKTIFMRAFKGISKYFVFSAFLIMAIFVKGEKADAANPTFYYAPNDASTVGTTSDKITPIGGTLSTSCVAPSQGEYLAYEIKGSSHDGNAEYKGCVSYTSDSKQVFYIQASQTTYTTITFKVSGVSELHHYVTVLEDQFSLSEENTYDYDQYKLVDKDTKEYEYSRKAVSIPTNEREATPGGGKDTLYGVTVTGEEGAYVYEFIYILRDAPNKLTADQSTAEGSDGDEYGRHNLYVYFYDADPEHNNSTEETEVSYSLAKPIDEYAGKIVVDIQDDNNGVIDTTTCLVDTDTLVDATNASQDQICILYAPKAQSGGTDNTHKTNKFLIKASNNIAFYFSTLNTHRSVVTGTPTSADVKKYNTVYATNTFTNIGEASEVKYNYYNAIDKSTYDYALSTKTANFYTFEFTIDASGNYKFTFTDIFGNTITSGDAATVTDISNRSLSTYQIEYKSNVEPGSNSVTKEGINSFGGGNAGSSALEAFELKDTLNILTNENVTLGLEFYYSINIKGDYGIGESGEIKMNPLAHGEIQFLDGTDARTYFCRLKNYEDASDSTDVCVEAGKGSNYVLNALNASQIIAANATTGLKRVENQFNYYLGALDPAAISAVTTRTTNRVSFELNENGRYFIRVQDKHGNSMTSTIDVTIIDQENPVIGFNGDNQTLSNVVCSSMYVVGGGGTIQGYPTGVLTAADCASNSVTYDHFALVDTTNGTEKQENGEVRAEFRITRPSGAEQGDSTVDSNGFYNIGSGKDTNTAGVTFNYADAIRMALLKASDSITIYGNTSTYKSVYRMVDDNTTYTSYGIYTYKDSSGTLVESKYDFGQGASGRNNLKNDYIIAHNYIQYSSELYSYFNDYEYVWFNVYALKANGDAEETAICSSQITDGTPATRKRVDNCYKVVNTYIDKAVSFVLEFFVRDYVGNVSVANVKVTIDVVDDTTPGVTEINQSTGAIKTNGDGDYVDPIISKNNIDTTCRLEIGSSIQNKNQLLKCYGLLSADGNQYYFVDNAATYEVLTVELTGNYYNNILHQQLYNTDYQTNGAITFTDTTYAANVEVYVCTVIGENACSVTDDSKWLPIPDTVPASGTDAAKYKFVNAGDYEIKFVISDSGRDYAKTHDKNVTTIIGCYYVNPRILLVRPMEEKKVYGQEDTVAYTNGFNSMDYCIYATTNTNAFFYNLFNLPASYGGDTYAFIKANYESELGVVYCTDDANPASNATLDGAKKVNVTEILANNTGAELEGALFRTYATGINKYNMELNTYNAYEDAGYYYATLGDLKVNDAHVSNYIIRLHPSYLLDGYTPNIGLKSYYHADLLNDNTYKYGTDKNTTSHGETISNVLFTIEQAELTVKANGGSKAYGHTDTNYRQAYNINATTNVSEITTNIKDSNNEFIKHTGSVSGYLNGFTIEGLITTLSTSTDKLNDYSYVVNGYNNILSGYLRRDAGENVGKYYICNMNVKANNAQDHSSDGCSINTNEINTMGDDYRKALTGGPTGNVYVHTGGTTYEHVETAADIVYGRYIGIDSDNNGTVDVYYKLTRNNTITDSDGKLTHFENDLAANLWRYKYDDSNYSLKVVVNANNALQNYYMVYVDNFYTINPAEIIIQPGINQGKEFSNPEHNDPIYELVVYGEKTTITATSSSDENDTTFNGYTQSIAKIPYPHENPDGTDAYDKTINSNTYNSTSGGKAADTEVYFSDRRTTSRELTSIEYVYEYDHITIDAVTKEFTLPQNGVRYLVTGTSICAVKDQTECISSGEKLGAITITLKDGNTIIPTIEGYLTFQDYKLFTKDADGANPGSGLLSRASGSTVGWYQYTYTASNLHVVSNGKMYCSHDATTFQYSVNGTTNCVNYNITYTANAAKKIAGADGDPDLLKTTKTASDEGYLHNGKEVCTDVTMYTVACSDTSKVQFLIFKRDIILSFNAQSYVYGNVYSYFDSDDKSGTFDITKTGINAVPDAKKSSEKLLFTCYRKAKSNELGYMAKNGKRYYALTEEECNGVDYGISSGDVWGESGINLQFYLNNAVADVFDNSGDSAIGYSLPSGTYFVYASIGTKREGTHGTDAKFVHDNYNLVYIDYDILVKGTTLTGSTYNNNASNKDGALEITPRAIKLVGTYYQKEFGQALYNTYDENGEELNYTLNDDGSVSYSLDNGATIKIFDNHYYYCEVPADGEYNGKSGLKFGCSKMNHSNGSEENYVYNSEKNVYLYTVIDDDEDSSDGEYAPMKHAGSKYDEIYANFAGSPVRLASGVTTGTSPAPKVSGDSYGLLDDAGYYTIYLGNIIPVIAQYKAKNNSDLVFSKDTGTIFRDENYSIAGFENGLLYITPGRIDITVTENQTKMYGCSYNKVDTSITDSTYSYGNGYANCVETVGQYYDLGYEYIVTGDKANHLLNNTSEYLDFNAGSTCDDLANKFTTRENPGESCKDITYALPVAGAFNYYKYKVTPDYGVEKSDGTIDDTTNHGKPANSSLNTGALYRINAGVSSHQVTSGDASKVQYKYSTYFDYATKAQLDPTSANIKFQEQQVGTYALTLGNLDAAFNGNKHCNANSAATINSPSSLCKNFIVVYGGNNTSKHTNTSASIDSYDVGENEVFDNDQNFTLTVNDFKFTIQKRNVVVTTEYNYKVYGDTDPNEGFTCSDLVKMYTYPTGSWYGTAFGKTDDDYNGRTSYCTSDDTFISTGVTRFYPIDNSLAKAPWTAWVDNGSEANTYYKYNDIFYDVFATTSKINRDGENTSAAAQNDAVGKYALVYVLSLSSGTNANGTNNYTIGYLSSSLDSATSQADWVKTETTKYTIGFAADLDQNGDNVTVKNIVSLDRWYRDPNHTCIIGTADGTNYNKACNGYTGNETYRFNVNGITHNTTTYTGNKYYASAIGEDTPVTTLKSEIYFEILRREIYIQTLPVTKDYGIEEKYTDFEVKLCSTYTSSVCVEVEPSNTWGVRNSLSIQDYEKFFGSTTKEGAEFSQEAFKGSADPAAYRGAVNDKQFGIYMYRTYGENVGEYVIVACATQFDGDNECRSKYAGMSNDNTRKPKVEIFTSSATTNAYNASNYIIKTIPSIITINVRNLYIIPDANQGFMYGNYESGQKVAPITYKEAYASGEGSEKTIHVDGTTGAITTSGLVNGLLKDSDDHVNNQVALCIFDISERLTCINDRQNTNNREIKKYVETGLHDDDSDIDISDYIASKTKDTDYYLIQNNIYNDNYDEDRDTSRHALDRSLKGGAGTANEIKQRYNRNVGVYIITQGDIGNNYCDVDTTVNCLNTNYAIYGFKDNVEYTITPATILVKPVTGQNKTYGYSDIHLTFTVETTFVYHTAPNADDADRYYCNYPTGKICQNPKANATFTNKTDYNESTHVVTLDGFAYAENVYDADLTTISSHNYGNSKVSDKTNSPEIINSSYGSSAARYYDKYCLNAKDVSEIQTGDNGCIAYTNASRISSVLFNATSRILLGYFYVEGYYQQVGTHNILSGITVAKNEYGNVNYLYKATTSSADVLSVGSDTGVDFTVNQLDVTATIKDIEKIYGQATDSYKCDAVGVTGHYQCTENNALNDSNLAADKKNNSLDNEGRLEYNFDVSGALVDTTTEAGKVMLVKPVVHDKFNTNLYYTETGMPEYKNIHLGLTVVRAINAYNADNELIVCGVEDDKFGCEDAGEYVLVFRKQAVTNNVDSNYNIKYGTATSTGIATEQEGYATVVSTTKKITESLGDYEYSGDASKRGAVVEFDYIVYKYSSTTIDEAFSGQNSKASPTSDKITIISGYSGKLVIKQRDIMFYIGTYDNDYTVTQRFVIEQNEQVPAFPKLSDDFTTSITTPASKATHYITWFDINEYGKVIKDSSKTYAPRQVRTSDTLVTTLDESLSNHEDPTTGHSLYGIYICSTPANVIQDVTYASCSSPTLYADANKIVDNKYVFDTSIIGDYALVRNRATTSIKNEAYEAKNYITDDYNGTLVIFADQTAPEIQVGNDKFAIEANADIVSSCAKKILSEKVVDLTLTTSTFAYDCSVVGKLFDEVAKKNNKVNILGQIISYMTLNFSGYNGTANAYALPANSSENKLPDSLATLSESWVYQPVNNIGVKYSTQGSTPTTLYDVYRSINTYDFDENYISTNLVAISSIISWFNINSYDYSYIRGEGEYADYISKRYTPRYYFYISGNETAGLDNFDPTYVGDFTVTIYVIDDVGNRNQKDVTLQIVDTTKPETGELHVFNHDVECVNANCQTNTINSWTVKAGYVNINAFVKYKKSGENYNEDNTNGTYIKLNGSYVNIYSDEVARYTYDGTNAVKNILGQYVLVVAKQTQAVEVEHKYWSNNNMKYIVVVGGKDNSFIDLDQDDDRSQWNTYYATDDINNWYKYVRHNNSGTPITFKDGVTSLYTRVIDSGRTFTLNDNSGDYVYYNNIYLRYVESGGNACTDLTDKGCVVVPNRDAQNITQVSDAEMTQDGTDPTIYRFKIHSINVTYKDDGANSKVTWSGNESGNAVNSNKFSFGIMTCTIDLAGLNVDCETAYTLVYNEAGGDKVTLHKPLYTVNNSINIGDWHVVEDTDADSNPIAITQFYNDRRYILIDTKAPVFSLSYEGYSIYEYNTKCEPSMPTGSEDSACEISYREHFVNASDSLSSSTTTGVGATAVNEAAKLAILSKTGFENIIFYTGSASGLFVKTDTTRFFYDDNGTSKPLPSGLLSNTSNVNGGSREFNSDVDVNTATEFNRHKVNLEVYLTAKSGSSNIWYRYIAIYTGEAYVIYRQAYDVANSKYAIIETFAATGSATKLTTYNSANLTTIEDVLQFIVSTASIDSAVKNYDLTFSINYQIKDAANNVSAHIENVTVRGITYVRLESTIYVDVPEQAAAMMVAEDEFNTYSINVNQGTSLTTLLGKFEVSNVNNKGINNMSTVMQSLYYNGEVLFENIAYNSDILSIIDSYGAPGTYTLKLTSTREAVSQDVTYIVNDDPLIINFVINPALAHVETNVDYSTLIVPVMLMAIFSVTLLGLGYVSIKKKKTNE